VENVGSTLCGLIYEPAIDLMTGGGYDLLPRESANLAQDVIRERRSRGFLNGVVSEEPEALLNRIAQWNSSLDARDL